AYTLKHQKAAEAFMLIHPLLSPRGTVELQPGGNTLVVRDTLAGLARVVPVLRNFDRAARPLRMEVYVVQASRNQPARASAPPAPPADLVRRLKAILPYQVFALVAQAQVSGLEGQPVTYEIGGGFEVSFRPGMVAPNRSLRLNDFRVLRRKQQWEFQTLLHTHLNLTLDQTVALTLAKSEASPDALMVVLTPHQDNAPRLP
ncbi:MAG TPA: secretin N-terminal domain-containing protein, partial [Thermoanaerobaculia bacterium]